MSIPTDSAARPAVRDPGAASENPKSAAASRPSSNAAGPSAAGVAKPNLASSIQALKELTSKSGTIFAAPAPTRLAGEPLSVAYEKRIHTLQDTLKERDQVVQMLTQRLEQAADQLDRVQRTGSGRGGSAVAGLPPELIENQQSLLEQLTRVLGDWEATQAGQSLARIESQITDLHDLVASGAGPLANVSAMASSATVSAIDHAGQRTKVSAGASVRSDISATEPAKTGWEAIKAAMLAGESYDPATASPPVSAPKPTAISEAATVESDPKESRSVGQRAAPPPLPEPPPAVDVDIADQATLIEAIRNRDEFIAILLRRLSSPDASTEFPDWEKLNGVPNDLHDELLNLRDRLQEKLRVAEVDLSLQRAKLAREEAKLSIKAEHLARQMRQLGLSPDDSGSPTAGSPTAGSPAAGSRVQNEGSNATQGRRWLQFLQRSNGHGSDTDGK